MTKRKTVGEKSLNASSDISKYNSLDLSIAKFKDDPKMIEECIEMHEKVFHQDEFFVSLIIAGDPLIKNVERHKVVATQCLPPPHPNQTVFLWSKSKQKIKRLWSLPDAYKMAIISTFSPVQMGIPFKYHPQFENMARWSKWYYEKTFWQNIRKEHDLEHYAAEEYLHVYRNELAKHGLNEIPSCSSEAFDFSKIQIDHINDTKTALPD